MHSLLDSFILHFVCRRSNILSHVLPKVKWMSSYGLSRGWRLMSTRTTRTLSTDRETSSWLRWNCCRQWTIQRNQAEWLQGEIRRSLLLPIGFVSTSCINLSFYQLYQSQFLSIVSILVSTSCINLSFCQLYQQWQFAIMTDSFPVAVHSCVRQRSSHSVTEQRSLRRRRQLS